MTEIIKNLSRDPNYSASRNLTKHPSWHSVSWARDTGNRSSDTPALEERRNQRLLRDARAQALESIRALSKANKRIAELEQLSRTDEVTGLDNRRGFDMELDAALARARRTGESGMLVLIDLDRFKAINDSYGHPAGDAILKAVAMMLRKNTRDIDTLARIGGDEFALILSDSKLQGAKAKAAQLDHDLNTMTVNWRNTRVGVHASFGAVPYRADDQADALYALADSAMYDRKRDRAAARN